ncbi:MAG: HAMP domain-containing histidine kinase [Sphaerochaetaceae bacterium]|nr:HAMP domain-containing histidine kinase [Sphaerochaetaceae bacterium]
MSSFVITCSMILMFHGADSAELLKSRAPLVFFNVFALSTILSVLDTVFRLYYESKPIKRILTGVQAISNGDFSYRIKPYGDLSRSRMYNPLIDGINRMAEELSNTEMLRTDFISNVSHELKTPLSTISAYCEILQDPSLSAEERTARIQTIMKSVRNLSALITNILRLNRIEHQQINNRRERFNLSSQLVECVLSYEPKWEEKDLQIDADIDEDVFVSGDKELLEIVWNNLISNAVKFTDRGGKLGVSLKKDGSKVCAAVSDSGCGMSEQTGRHIFDKFYQGDTSHATEGNGLGLSMVKKIVDLHRGTVEVESEIGKGSTFRVYLDTGV